MARRAPPLVALWAFEALGRLGSMRKAAGSLGVNHTVVGRHIATLEAWLGRKLVVADFRGVRLTPAGLELHQIVSTAFSMIEKGADNVRSSRRGELRLWCSPGLAVLWLMPRLTSLRTALAGSEIVLSVRDDWAEFGSSHIDVAIHYGQVAAPGMRCEELIRPRMLAVASKEFIAAHPGVRTADDVSRLPLLHEQSTRPWQRWLRAAGVETEGELPGVRLHHAHLAMEAALLGEGVALVNWLLVRHHIETGRLVEAIPSRISVDGYQFCTPAGSWDEDRIVQLRAWLRAELEPFQE